MNFGTAYTLSLAIGEMRAHAIDLLKTNELPVSDLTVDKDLFVVTDGGLVVGTAGLETFHDCGLLRSLSVRKNFRNKGLGKLMVTQLEEIATRKGISHLYLLTTTAKEFFENQGYITIERNDAPQPIQTTEEFSTLCAATAILMKKELR